MVDEHFTIAYRDARPEDLPWYHAEPDTDLMALIDQVLPVVARKSPRPSRGHRVPVVKSADSLKCDHLSGGRRFNIARGRRVARKRHMRSVIVVIGHVRSNEAEQMTLAEDDDLIKQFST